MRTYLEKQPSREAYYKADRFYMPKQTLKIDAKKDFAGELSSLKETGVEIAQSFVELTDLVIEIAPTQNLLALNTLKNFGYEQLSELSAIDFSKTHSCFRLFYQLLSLRYNRRLRLVCKLEIGQQISSATSVYASANWSERECYDMFGIIFVGHKNLKRLLMPDDWFGHPLLKSYPLHGDEHARWYEVDKIFGKEYREVIGPENRDSAYADEKDSFNFASLSQQKYKGQDELMDRDYQESQGVGLVKKVSKDSSKQLKERP